jgi:molybdenum cofactor cytidylyltransferase
MSNQETIAAVILAAGASTRMGTPKQLLLYQGKSLLRRITETAIAADCSPVVVVLGANCDRLCGEVNDLPVQVVENQDWQTGMGASIRSGIHELINTDGGVEAAILLLCDQPLVSGQTIHQLQTLYRSTRSPIVASGYQGIIGVPALFQAALFSELTQLTQEGARTVMQRYIDSVVVLDFPQGAIDIDTPDQYQQWLGQEWLEQV